MNLYKLLIDIMNKEKQKEMNTLNYMKKRKKMNYNIN